MNYIDGSRDISKKGNILGFCIPVSDEWLRISKHDIVCGKLMHWRYA
ncbi:hypothetical protein [Chryseobacterium viscerum]|nr:hypothetical protein [Chryseobacterium viscerum]